MIDRWKADCLRQFYSEDINCDWKTHLKVKSWGKRWRNRPFWDQTAPIHDLIACKCRQFKNQDKPPSGEGIVNLGKFSRNMETLSQKIFHKIFEKYFDQNLFVGKIGKCQMEANCQLLADHDIAFLIFEWVQGWERNFDGKWEILLFI